MIHAFLSVHLPSTLLEKRYVFSYLLRKASTADVDHAETPTHLGKTAIRVGSLISEFGILEMK